MFGLPPCKMVFLTNACQTQGCPQKASACAQDRPRTGIATVIICLSPISSPDIPCKCKLSNMPDRFLIHRCLPKVSIYMTTVKTSPQCGWTRYLPSPCSSLLASHGSPRAAISVPARGVHKCGSFERTHPLKTSSFVYTRHAGSHVHSLRASPAVAAGSHHVLSE